MKIVQPAPESFTPEDQYLVHRVFSLPHKILRHHEIDRLSELVLHELSHDACFGLKKATYLVDNPDFDHLKGIAGFCKDECKYHKQDLWSEPHTFSTDMKNASYQKTVQQVIKNSLKRKDINLDNSSDILELGKLLGMNEPKYLSWHGKHGNHGVLLFEKEGDINPWRRGFFDSVVALLGLCTL